MNAPLGWGGGARSAAWRGCLRASICLSAAMRVPTDYVLVRGATREAELAAGVEPVFLSEPRGLIEVWRPRTRTASR